MWTVSGTGDYETYDHQMPWWDYGESIKIAEINVTGMTDASSMFAGCSNLTTLNLNNFETSSVTDMSRMFDSCSNLTALDLSNFNTSKVTNMFRMFAYCENLTALDLSNFDTSSVTDMSRMFDSCYNLTALDVSHFDTSELTNMCEMFSGCENLTALDISKFNTHNVTDMKEMFSGCHNLTMLDVSHFDTSKVTNMEGMFSGCYNLTTLYANNFNTSKVTDMSSMFGNCHKLTTLTFDVSRFNTSNVSSMKYMFGWCKNLTTLDVSHFDTSKVTDMNGMFIDCSNLTTLDVSKFNTNNVTDMSNMFDRCLNLTTLNLSNFDTSSVTDMSTMFSGCGNLTTLDVSHFDTSKVTNMRRMFDECENLIALDVSSFNTSSVTDMCAMFDECRTLTTLDLASFDTQNVKDAEYMISYCNGLSCIYTPCNHTLSVSLPANAGDKWYRSDDGTEVTELPKNLSDSITLERKRTPEEENPANPMSGKSGNISWEIDANGNLMVSGTGDWESKTVNDARWTPWYDDRESIKAAEIKVTGMTDASYMFAGCGNLSTLDVSNFNTRSVTDMSGMFSNCISLSELDLRSFDASSVTNMSGMFSGCSNLTTLYTPRNVTQSVSLPVNPGYVWFRSDGTEVTELPRYEKDSILITMIKKSDIPSDDDPQNDDDDGVLDDDIPEDGVIPEGLWISRIADQTFTGTAIKPEVRVYEGKTRLKQGADYTLNYKNNTMAAGAADAKPPTIVVKGKGNYTGTETKTFTITKCNISDTYVTKTFADAYTPLANGKNPTLVFNAKYNKKALKKNTDYTLTVKNNTGNEVTSYGAVGTYTAIIKGVRNYTGEYNFSFEVLDKVPVNKLKISKIAAVTYDGESKTPEPVIKYGKVTLSKGTDYTLSYLNNTEIGTATVTVEGKGDYFGKRDITFLITGLQIKKAKFTGFQTSFPYTGDMIYQNEAVLKYGENNLVEGKDYTVRYSNCLNKGKATVTYTGIGKYTGTIKRTYNITAYNIAADAKKRIALSADKISAAYAKGGARPSLKVYDRGRLLSEGKDYTLSYQNNAAVTTSATVKQPTITVKGKGNYAGAFSEKKTFTITAKDIAEITVTAPDVAASAQIGKYKSIPALTDTNGKKLKAGTDYEKIYTYTYKTTTEKVLSNGTEVKRNAGDPVEEKDIVPANTVLCVRIKAKEGSNYTGEKTAEYRIVTSLVNKAKITVKNPAQNNANLFSYTGQAIRLDKSNLVVKVGMDVLSDDQYEILEDTYKNNVAKGTASVQIRGVGDYGGTATVKFKIGTKSFQWIKRLFD